MEQSFLTTRLAERARLIQDQAAQRQRELKAARQLAETEAQASASWRNRVKWLAGTASRLTGGAYL